MVWFPFLGGLFKVVCGILCFVVVNVGLFCGVFVCFGLRVQLFVYVVVAWFVCLTG